MMYNKLIVSICPLFLCNNTCAYCYLGKLRKHNNVLKLHILDSQMKLISSQHYIEAINVFGGEITLLDKNYITNMQQCLSQYCQNITMTSNMYDISKLMSNKMISTSYNFCRSDFKHIQQTIVHNPEIGFDLSIVVLDDIIELSLDELFSRIPSNCNSIQFQKYSPSIYNDVIYHITDEQYDTFLINAIHYYLQHRSKYHFQISNIKDILEAVNGKYNPLMNSNIFILPSGKFAVIRFDNDREYFYEFSSLNEYETLCAHEQHEYFRKCCVCQFYGHCYTEHLNLNKKCSGAYSVLKHFTQNQISI